MMAALPSLLATAGFQMNWEPLATSSHYKTAVAVKAEIEHGNMAEALHGLQELIEALSRSEKRALKSQLVRLMLHLIKRKTQPERRSLSWIASIADARDEIVDIQEETPSLTDSVVESLWGKAFAIAKRDVEAEMGKESAVVELSWKEVFADKYDLDDSVS
jgi:hypothetical protein